jgi:hypothetical protein
MREIKRDVQKYTWNRVNTKIGAVITQAGTLEGIENIKPPRLLYSYVSAYYQQDDFAADRTFRGLISNTVSMTLFRRHFST